MCVKTMRALCDHHINFNFSNFTPSVVTTPYPLLRLVGIAHFMLNYADTNVDYQCLLIGFCIIV